MTDLVWTPPEGFVYHVPTARIVGKVFNNSLDGRRDWRWELYRRSLNGPRAEETCLAADILSGHCDNRQDGVTKIRLALDAGAGLTLLSLRDVVLDGFSSE